MKTYCIVCKKDTENKTKNESQPVQFVIRKNQDLSVKMKDLVYYQVLESKLL